MLISSLFVQLRRAACWGVLLPLILLGGCSTLSKDECLRGDWRQYGYYDGTHGYPPGRIEEHREACAEHGVRPDPAAYAAGREAGLRLYCTPANGFERGKSGATYHGVCRPETEGGFLRAYRLGWQIHELSDKIRYLESQIRDKEKELEKDKLSDEQRRNIRERIRSLDREKSNLKGVRQGLELSVYY